MIRVQMRQEGDAQPGRPERGDPAPLGLGGPAYDAGAGVHEVGGAVGYDGQRRAGAVRIGIGVAGAEDDKPG